MKELLRIFVNELHTEPIKYFSYKKKKLVCERMNFTIIIHK